MTEPLNTYSFIFFGEDVFSLAVLESLLDSQLCLQPLAVVILQPITISGRRLVAFCSQRGIPIIETQSVRSDIFLSHFTDMNIDLILSAHFQRLLPKSLFEQAKIGALNLHPSLLPRYRGMSPQHWPIIFGDRETGVTVHRIEDGIDTGRILCQIPIKIDSSMYIHDLQKIFLSVYRSIMVKAVERAITGDPGEQQSTEEISFFHKISEEDMEITTDTKVERAHNMIRAFSFPYEGAKFKNIRIMNAIRAEDSIWNLIKESSVESSLIEHQGYQYLLLKDGALKLIKWKLA